MNTKKNSTLNYFVSGSNHAGEIEGLAAVGFNVGVAAPHVNESAALALLKLVGTGIKVFVDSGAFGEVTFENGAPEVKALISEAAWMVIFGLYLRLARVLGGQLYVVAPDMVGFQKESLERLERYAHIVTALRLMGANVIVPVQKGRLPMALFAKRACSILGVTPDQVIWGVPSKKDATSLKDLKAFASWLGCQKVPTRLHLLGLGVRSPKYLPALAAVKLAAPNCTVFSDSVRITALVGRGKDGKHPRKLTAALDAAKATGLYKNATEWKCAAMKEVFAQEMAEAA